MNAAEEMAKMLKDRDNAMPYSPVEGVVVCLPELKIRISEKIAPGADMLKSIINLYDTDADGNYIWLGRRVYLLPFYSPNTMAIQKYLVIGGDAI